MAPLEIATVHGILQFGVNNDFAHEFRPRIAGEDNRHDTSPTVAGTGVIPPVRTDRRISIAGPAQDSIRPLLLKPAPEPSPNHRTSASVGIYWPEIFKVPGVDEGGS